MGLVTRPVALIRQQPACAPALAGRGPNPVMPGSAFAKPWAQRRYGVGSLKQLVSLVALFYASIVISRPTWWE
jgi:hypothetical protein